MVEMLVYVFLGIVLLLMFISVITLLLKKSCEKKLKNISPIYLGKLNDKTNDNINKAMQYLELTNSIKN